MRISINDVVISFELENETNAGDVFDGIAAWLRSSGNHIQTVTLNETIVLDAAETDEKWRTTPLDSIDDLAVSASSIYQDRIDQLETIITYVDLFRRVMAEGSSDDFDAVMDELPHVVEGIARLTPELSGLLEERIADRSAEDTNARAAAAARATDLSTALVQRQREFLDPEHEMRITVTAIESILPEFEHVPARMQTGREAEALEMVAHFSELAARMFRLMPIVMVIRPELEREQVGDTPLVESMPKLNNILMELEEAIRIRDYVLIGDLMEYELLPHFTQLSDVFGSSATR